MRILNKHFLLERRKELRRKCTGAEFTLWLYLKGKFISEERFRRQYSIGNYIVDFCCPKKKLVIEVDGGIHNKPENRLYDDERQKSIENLGFKVIRFCNKEVIENTEKVLTEIKRILKEIN